MPWQSDYKKPRKKYKCGWCGSIKNVPYKWVDGKKSCEECNVQFGEDRFKEEQITEPFSPKLTNI